MKEITNKIQIQTYQIIVEAKMKKKTTDVNRVLNPKKKVADNYSSIFFFFHSLVVIPNGPRNSGLSAGTYHKK